MVASHRKVLIDYDSSLVVELGELGLSLNN